MPRNPNGSVIVDDNGYPIDSVDPMEWAEAFDQAPGTDDELDVVAAWFASALMTGQANSGDTIPLEF